MASHAAAVGGEVKRVKDAALALTREIGDALGLTEAEVCQVAELTERRLGDERVTGAGWAFTKVCDDHAMGEPGVPDERRPGYSEDAEGARNAHDDDEDGG